MTSETRAARAYWAGRKVGAFSRRREWSGQLADRIVAFGPRKVFEFGCNVGRHLVEIRERDPSIILRGVDINVAAVETGRRNGLPLAVGDETYMARFTDDEFDVAYTASVIDHIPDPTLALREMARIAPVLVFLEPWMGYEGKVEWVSEGVRANRFLYSWDYAARLPHHDVTSEPLPLRPEGAGPYYRLHVACHRSA
jgi:SAM-dependent methyltransferase